MTFWIIQTLLIALFLFAAPKLIEKGRKGWLIIMSIDALFGFLTFIAACITPGQCQAVYNRPPFFNFVCPDSINASIAFAFISAFLTIPLCIFYYRRGQELGAGGSTSLDGGEKAAPAADPAPF